MWTKLISFNSIVLFAFADSETLFRLGRKYDSDAQNMFSLRDSFKKVLEYFEPTATTYCFCDTVPCPKEGLELLHPYL
jgi:hypothetical protein